MKCGEVYDGLIKVDQGDVTVSGSIILDLIKIGMLAEVTDAGAPNQDMQELKEELANIISERKTVISKISEFAANNPNPQKMPQYEQYETRMDFLAKKSHELREKILAFSSIPTEMECLKTASGMRVQITYAGREAMHNIGSRFSRIRELDYQAFIKQMDDLGKVFQERASRAKELLKAMAPKLKDVDEIHLRTAAVGLSCIKADTGTVVSKFVNYHQKLKGKFHNENIAIAAETFTILELREKQPVDLDEISNIVKAIYSTSYAKFDENYTVERSATILYSSARSNMKNVLGLTEKLEGISSKTSVSTRILLGLECVEGEAPAEVLARYNLFLKLIGENIKETANLKDQETAAALLTLSEMEFETLAQRFRIATNLLDELFLTRLDTAAAMIAIMNQDVAESIDNIRFASAAVIRVKMSLSGLENFSLGLKLAVHSGALLTTKTATPRLAAIHSPANNTELLGLTVILPMAAGIPYLMFHDEMVHRRAVTDYRFHPVHSHYMYG